MKRKKLLIAVPGILLVTLTAFAQSSSNPPSSTADTNASATTTVRGCLDGQRGNYIVVEDKTGLVYVLKGVGNKLNKQVHHQVEVTGRIRPGTTKTGVNPTKSGSNPADTAHGVDGVPLEVADVNNDIRVVAKHCKAADQQ